MCLVHVALIAIRCAREHCGPGARCSGSRCGSHGSARWHAAVHAVGSANQGRRPSVGVGAPPRASATAAVLIGMLALGIGLGPAAAVCAIALMAVAFGSLAWLSMRQIGGQTGDVLGALEQIGEIIVLLVAAA